MKSKFNLFLTILVLLFFILQNKSFSEKISIIYIVEDIPITNVEINNEINYLLLINENLKEIDKEALVQYGSKSILKEKIKELEIARYYKFGQNPKLVNESINSLMLNLNIQDENEFNKLLTKHNLSKKFLSKKIEIELMWNRLIYEMYRDKISLDEKKISENLKKNINNQLSEIDEYHLYEILFSPKTTADLDSEIKKIYKSIADIGFENTANIFSISHTSTLGGEIGWINENQLSKEIIKTVQNLNIGDYSNPMNVPSGNLILLLKDKRKIKNNLSYDEQLSKIIMAERNKQLNQFSSIYYKKVELNTKIYDK